MRVNYIHFHFVHRPLKKMSDEELLRLLRRKIYNKPNKVGYNRPGRTTTVRRLSHGQFLRSHSRAL